MCLGILESIITIKFPVFVQVFFQKSFTLNFVHGLVFEGIFNLADCHINQVTSILHHNIKSKIGTS